MNNPDFYDGNATTPYRGVSGGFRAGKRRKGNSLLKRKPREAVKVIKFDVHDPDGRVVALGATMVTMQPNSTSRRIEWWEMEGGTPDEV